jgi:HSP20 family protein
MANEKTTPAQSQSQPQTSPGSHAGTSLSQRDRDREARGMQRYDPVRSPFEFMDRMSEEMDRWFDRVSRDFGVGRQPLFSRRSFGPGSGRGATSWAPLVEAFQKDDKFIVRAELPGLRKEDVEVELTDEALTIRGERKAEHQEEREGYWHSEREYGQFQRRIPIPDGVISESAQASFKDGLLEVTMQAAPAEANRGRRLEIKDAASPERKS